jgi:hypothetical protein
VITSPKQKKLYIFTDTKNHGGEWQVKRKTNQPGILRFKTNGQQEIIMIDLASSYDCWIIFNHDYRY